MDSPLALVVTIIVSAVLGAAVVLAWRVSERQQASLPDQPEPVVPTGADSVLSVLRSSAVLVGEGDMVLKASAPAFTLGIINGDRLVSQALLGLVHSVRRDGQIREAELELNVSRVRGALQVHARVAPLGSRLVLVLVEDRTRERRVESIRRDFVANVSHELKTPVGALTLLAEAVGEAADDPDTVRRFAGRMQTESARLTTLVQQIIELSRLQGDRLVDEPIPCSIDELVDAAISQSSTEAEVKNVTLVAERDPTLVVLGSPEQLTVALSNLVENAVAYSPDGTRVAVMVARDGDQVRISVRDQGIGIPQAEIDRIFERFYRVDPARARTTGGTGLGLSIVKHVAASHGGDIEVWSQENEGSSFTLVLPAYARRQDSEDEGADVRTDAVDIASIQSRPLVNTQQSKEKPS